MEMYRPPCRHGNPVAARAIAAIVLLIAINGTNAQSSAPAAPAGEKAAITAAGQVSDAPKTVAVDPTADDDAIVARLVGILEATKWFQSPGVRVDEGVVFLEGGTSSQTYKEWAGKLAANTQDVVAVVNRIEVIEAPMWDLSPARSELEQLAKEGTRALPLFAIGCALLAITWLIARLASRLSRAVFKKRLKSDLLNNLLAYVVAIPVFLVGVYLVLRVTGLTRLAMTVLGGTGLFGLIIGIAFRDIAENFLASILISTRRPFEMGDLIEVAGQRGFVQLVSTRGTLLMTLEGNHVMIPNSTIYKDTITNFTANPNVRLDISVGIGFDSSISLAQESALRVLKSHDAVLSDPEPLVLVEELGAATVNMRLYFWVDGHAHSAIKVKSAIIRLVKRALERNGISMPDEAREVIFPNGVDVRMSRNPSDTSRHQGGGARQIAATAPNDADDRATNPAEGDLANEANEIKEQARRSRPPEGGENLIESPSTA